MLTAWVRNNLPLLAVRTAGEVQCEHHCYIRKSSSNECPLDQLSTLQPDSVGNEWLVQ